MISNEEFIIEDTLSKMNQVLKNHKYLCIAVSGGADSDIMIDLFEKNKLPHNELTYLFYDTGLEFEATKRHLNYLEDKYNIEIVRYRGEWTIPRAVRNHGVPLFNKSDAHAIDIGQRHGFSFDDNSTFEEDVKYLVGVSKWWYQKASTGYNVSNKRKKYIIENPINFRVSERCCDLVKKRSSKEFMKANKHLEITCVGLRTSEGGSRSKLKECYNKAKKQYYPILHWTDSTRKFYENAHDIKHSDCYEVWGFKRTGCAGCPFARYYKKDLEIIKKYEPLMYKACTKVFKDSYDYLDKY